MIEYLSMGAGPPSIALMILNATKRIPNPTKLIMWADTGWEKQATYDMLPIFQDYAAEFEMEWIGVQSKDGPLDQYVREKSVPIPVHTEGQIGKRQCTDKWKIAPIEQYLHARFGKNEPLTAQLAMTQDEWERVRNPRVKRNRNRWPLIEQRLTRADCIEIITQAGLPVPPWSACKGCPLQNDGRWRVTASEFPADFDEACDIDEFLRERAEATGKAPVWLHWSRKPLRSVYTTGQLNFLHEPSTGACESGYCFT